MKSMNWLLLGAALTAHAAFAGPLVFTLLPPEGVLAGPQGTPVGWGYQITTTDSGYFLINSITFEDLTPVGTMPAETWFISSDFISSGSPLTVPWTPGLNGLQYEIAWDAVVGAKTTGTMTLNYEWLTDLSGSIESDLGSFDVLATNDAGQTITAEVNVQQGEAVVPEPGSLLLLGSAVVALILRRKVVGAITST